MVVVFPAPFGPRYPRHLSLGHLEVQVLQRINRSVPLGQPFGSNGYLCHHNTSTFRKY
jgi:hypothetical protein